MDCFPIHQTKSCPKSRVCIYSVVYFYFQWRHSAEGANFRFLSPALNFSSLFRIVPEEKIYELLAKLTTSLEDAEDPTEATYLLAQPLPEAVNLVLDAKFLTDRYANIKKAKIRRKIPNPLAYPSITQKSLRRP